MEVYGKQTLYTKEHYNKFFLSSYAVVSIDEEGIFAGRIDSETSLCIKLSDSDQEKLFELFTELRNGIEQNVFIQSVKDIMNDDSEIFIKRLIQEGVIE